MKRELVFFLKYHVIFTVNYMETQRNHTLFNQQTIVRKHVSHKRRSCSSANAMFQFEMLQMVEVYPFTDIIFYDKKAS